MANSTNEQQASGTGKNALGRLHAGNSAVYRPKPLEKRARLEWKAAKYQLEWGAQEFPGPHMVVSNEGGDYGVDLRVFYETHSAVPGKPDHYVKTEPVRAVKVEAATELETHVREKLEAKATIQPGGWLIQNPGGELYYNSPAEFEKRYEPVTESRPPRPQHPTLKEHLESPGPKRILALDGGGIRGRITLGILKRIESTVGPLHDYFDLIGGTSTGSIIAAGLALGWSVDRLIRIYDTLGASVFERTVWRQGLWRAKFPAEPLERELKANFGDVTLEDPQVKTGLCIVCKRLDTNSVWPLHNNPRGRYWNRRPGRSSVANKDYLISQLVRASCAAPHYFDPEMIAVSEPEDGPVTLGTFVDGGASPHNNPSLQLVLLATLKGYGFEWPLGAENLQVVSVGTGTWDVKHDATALTDAPAAVNAGLSLLSLMDDCSWLNEAILQWLSDGPTHRRLDGELGDLKGDILGGKDPWVKYLRYNAPIELEWLTANLPGSGITQAGLDSLRAMDNADSLKVLARIGDAAGNAVEKSHFT